MIEAIFGGSLAVAALVSAFVAFAKALDAERRCADARVNDATKAGRIAVQEATITSLQGAVEAQKRRADAFDAVLEEVAVNGDAAGARARVLARLEHDAGAGPAAAGGADPGTVHEPAAAGVAAHIGPAGGAAGR